MRVLKLVSALCLFGLVGHAAAQARELPDFTRLVEEQARR